MLNKQEQLVDKIYSDEELSAYSEEMYNDNYNHAIIVDSNFGKQYFKYLAANQKQRYKSESNIVIQGGVYSNGSKELRDI
jgi:hypothetical protein